MICSCGLRRWTEEDLQRWRDLVDAQDGSVSPHDHEWIKEICWWKTEDICRNHDGKPRSYS